MAVNILLPKHNTRKHSITRQVRVSELWARQQKCSYNVAVPKHRCGECSPSNSVHKIAVLLRRAACNICSCSLITAGLCNVLG